MHLGIAQIDTVPGDLAQIFERVVASSRMAAEQGCELLLFPLTTLAGPAPLPYGVASVFRSACLSSFEAAARELACPCALPYVGLVGDVPAVEIWIAEHGTVSVHGQAREAFEAPAPADVAPAEDIVCTCADTRILFVFSYEELDCLGGPDDPGGYDVVAFLSGYGYAANDPSSALGAALAESRFVADVRATRAWFAAVGPVGGYGSQVYGGSSFVLAPDASLVACARAFEEDLVCVEVTGSHGLAGEGLSFEPYDGIYHLWQTLSLGLADHVRKGGYAGAVLVYDGSLPSRALAVLACDALGPTRVRVLPSPALGSKDRAVLDELAHALRLSVDELSLGEAAGLGVLGQDACLCARALELARGEGLELLSSRDKTDLCLGVPSLWDEVADLAPLGDVYRSDVAFLLRLRNTITPVAGRVEFSESDVVSLEGLPQGWDAEALAQEVDGVLEQHLEGEMSFSRILDEAAEGYRPIIRCVMEGYAAKEARRHLAPRCLIASTCAVTEALLPYGFAWHDDGTAPVERPSAPRAGAVPVAAKPERGSVQGLPSGDAFEGALKEALDLLRDISVGSGTDWQNPFSEN